MKLEITGLSKLDAVELHRQLGDAAVRRQNAGGATEVMQDLGTTALLLVLLSPEIIAGVVAWALKARRRTKITLVSTDENGASERLEIDATESDQLDPKVLEKLAQMSRQPLATLKQAVAHELKKKA